MFGATGRTFLTRLGAHDRRRERREDEPVLVGHRCQRSGRLVVGLLVSQPTFDELGAALHAFKHGLCDRVDSAEAEEDISQELWGQRVPFAAHGHAETPKGAVRPQDLDDLGVAASPTDEA